MKIAIFIEKSIFRIFRNKADKSIGFQHTQVMLRPCYPQKSLEAVV